MFDILLHIATKRQGEQALNWEIGIAMHARLHVSPSNSNVRSSRFNFQGSCSFSLSVQVDLLIRMYEYQTTGTV